MIQSTQKYSRTRPKKGKNGKRIVAHNAPVNYNFLFQKLLLVALAYQLFGLHKRVSFLQSPQSAQEQEQHINQTRQQRDWAVTEPNRDAESTAISVAESLPRNSSVAQSLLRNRYRLERFEILPVNRQFENLPGDPSVAESLPRNASVAQPLPKRFRKRQKGFWDYHAKTLKKLKVPTPIILLGFPKAGTTSIDHYFRCHGLHVSHELCYNNPYSYGKPQNCGRMMMHNLEHGRPMFQNTGNYHVYTGLFYSSTCIFPQITHLEQIHESHPNATFVLHMRDLDKWVDSMRRWTQYMNYGTMFSQLTDCFVENPDDRTNQTIADLAVKNAYQKVIDGARKLVQEHPSHRLIELHIDREGAAEIMDASFFHSPKEGCWKQANLNKKKQATVNDPAGSNA